MYKVTDYVLQVMTRWVLTNEQNTKDFIETEAREKFEDYEKKIGNFTVSYYLEYDEDDDDGNIFPQVQISVTVYFDKSGLYFNIFNKPYAENKAKDIVEEMILALKGKEFSCCKMPYCEGLAEEEGLCEICYIHDWTRGEMCCVCHEDGGHWVQLDCGHILHNICARRVSLKCPLCRHQHVGYKVKDAMF